MVVFGRPVERISAGVGIFRLGGNIRLVGRSLFFAMRFRIWMLHVILPRQQISWWKLVLHVNL